MSVKGLNVSTVRTKRPHAGRSGEGKERLLDAARELFWRNGFEATSPQQIYDHSGVGQGSFYHHFSGKLDLVHAVLSLTAEEEVSLLNKLTEDIADPLERLIAYLSLPRDGRKGCKIGRFVFGPSIENTEIHAPVRAYFKALERFLTGNIREAIATGKLGPLPLAADQLASILLTTVQGGYVVSRAFGDKARLRIVTGAAVALLESWRR